MTFIDWSDAEEMLDLLTEFIRDARTECNTDLARRRFLSQLLLELKNLSTLAHNQKLKRLQTICGSIDEEFKADPVTRHIEDCIIELERLWQRNSS